jgi:exosortase
MLTQALPDSTQVRATARNAWFVGLVAATAVAFAAPLTMLGQLTLQQEHYSHIVLIPAISIFLLLRDRRRIFAQVETRWREGAGVLVGGLLFGLVASRSSALTSENDRLSATILALVASWLGLFILCYGLRAFRSASFPLLFLLLMVPIPDALLDRVIVWLQTWSAEISHVGFTLLGVPVFREGLVFSLPGLSIEVARECSGIRSSLALLITSLLAGQLFLRSAWTKVVVFLVAVPLLVVKNGIRIVTLSLLTLHVDPDFLAGDLHRQGGIVFFLITLGILAPVIWLLDKAERSRRHARP